MPDEPRWRIEACRSEGCRKAIIWAGTVGGKSMPVDAAPLPAGQELAAGSYVRLTMRQGFPFAEVISFTGPRMVAEPLRTSHFATCLDAAKWRKRGRS